jgi:hypothetical protein
MHARTLPRHARSGLLAIGWRKPRPGEDGPQPIWPILGGDGRGESGGSGDGSGNDDDSGGDGDQGNDGDGPGTGDGGDGDQGDDSTDHKAAAEKWQALARKWEQRAKKNSGAAEELARLKREGMSETEAAVAAARAEERVRGGERIARSAFLAAAKGRISDPQAVVEEINLRKYVDDDGEVDDDAIAALVDKLAPQQSGTDDEDDDERDTRRRRRPGSGYQGARNGSGRSKSKRGEVDGPQLFEDLLGRKPRTSSTS